MKGIIQAMLDEIYENARTKAVEKRQIVGEKSDYYITLWQLEDILKQFEG